MIVLKEPSMARDLEEQIHFSQSRRIRLETIDDEVRVAPDETTWFSIVDPYLMNLLSIMLMSNKRSDHIGMKLKEKELIVLV